MVATPSACRSAFPSARRTGRRSRRTTSTTSWTPWTPSTSDRGGRLCHVATGGRHDGSGGDHFTGSGLAVLQVLVHLQVRDSLGPPARRRLAHQVVVEELP